MSKEIKFRGKSKESGEWLFGYLLYYGITVFIAPIGVGWFDIVGTKRLIKSKFEVIPETVGQFTGQTDKKGKEIYEGDIYSVLGYEVVDGKQTRPKRIIEVKFTPSDLFRLENLVIGNGTVEIIGNIHENPELLK